MVAKADTADPVVAATAEALRGGNESDCVSASSLRLAEVQVRLAWIRRAKAEALNRCIAVHKQQSKPGSPVTAPTGLPDERSDSSPRAEMSIAEAEALAVCDSLKELATLENYERKTLSRRKKLGFAHLLAIERSGE
ncbi:hypothetical protein [Mesorhizobium sp. 10J20-29]